MRKDIDVMATLGKMEDVTYLIRMNLYWWNEDNQIEDWRDAKIVSFVNGELTIQNETHTLTGTLEEFEELSLKCHEENWARVEEYFKQKEEA